MIIKKNVVMFIDKLTGSNEVIFKKHILVKTIFKLAILKAGMNIKNIKNFLMSEQWYHFNNSYNQQVFSLGNNKKLSGKFHQIKTGNGAMAYTTPALPVNIIDIGQNKHTDHLGKTTNMSPAQVVYAVILMQQIEWNKEAENITQ